MASVWGSVIVGLISQLATWQTQPPSCKYNSLLPLPRQERRLLAEGRRRITHRLSHGQAFYLPCSINSMPWHPWLSLFYQLLCASEGGYFDPPLPKPGFWFKAGFDLLADICLHEQYPNLVANVLGIILWDQHLFSFGVRLKKSIKGVPFRVDFFCYYLQEISQLNSMGLRGSDNFPLTRDCVIPLTRIWQVAEKFIDLWINKKSQRLAQAATHDCVDYPPWRWGICNLVKLFFVQGRVG